MLFCICGSIKKCDWYESDEAFLRKCAVSAAMNQLEEKCDWYESDEPLPRKRNTKNS